MFVMTLNKGGLKKLAAVGVCALALAAGALGLRMLDKGGEAVDTAAVPTSALNQKINGAEDVKAFLAGYGLEVDPTTAEVTAVKVPRKWDDSFKAFHEVIQKSGLDLKKCKGKEVDKWVVPIPAQSNEAVKTYAVVLVYKNEPKGAYLLEKPSGEVKPLTPAQSTSATVDADADAVLQAAQEAAAQQAAQSADPAQQEAQPAPEPQPSQDAAATPDVPAPDAAAQDAAAAVDITAADAGAVPVE